MKQPLLAACLAACALGAAAADPAGKVGAGGTVPPAPGYAFDRPELLADQYLWGIAHGARLLGHACGRAGDAGAYAAWAAWEERETAAIAASARRLGRHYFRREDATPAELAAALGLRPALDLAPERLAAACATLPAALAQPRYDLTRRREEMLKK